MVRRSIVVIACALVLAGCDGSPVRAPGRNVEVMADTAAPTPPSGIVAGMAPAQGQQFSYTHDWSLVMARAAVSPRFLRARERCLSDKALSCRLVSANISSGNDVTSATLEVQLPHGKLDVFEKALMAPVAGESAGDAQMIARSTQAQSVETEASDTARKVLQLTAYRDRLADIAKRPNLSVDDIIKVEAEEARVQGELDDATNQHRDLTDGIARESVTIQLAERVPPPPGRWSRLADDAGSTLSDSAASALLFAIGALPWLPIVAAAIMLVSWLWRGLLRRRKLAAAPAREQPAG